MKSLNVTQRTPELFKLIQAIVEIYQYVGRLAKEDGLSKGEQIQVRERFIQKFAGGVYNQRVLFLAQDIILDVKGERK